MAQIAVQDVERTFDAARVNAIANHPDVHPGLSLGEGALDVSALIGDPHNIFYLGEFGGAALIETAPHEFEAHDFILPEGRGAWALQACKAILSRMFAEHGAKRVYAVTPAEHRACRLFNRLLGFKSKGGDLAVLIKGRPARPVERFEMVAPCL